MERQAQGLTGNLDEIAESGRGQVFTYPENLPGRELSSRGEECGWGQVGAAREKAAWI
jgi:hypothetical protein